MNKFLDENNIIKKDEQIEVVEDTEDVQLTFVSQEDETATYDKSTSLVMPKEETKKTTKTKKNTKTTTIKKPSIGKSKYDLMIEMLDKFNVQLITKEIEIEVAHKLYNNAQSNDDRRRQQMTYENLEKDIKVVKLKIKTLEEMIKKWQKD